jgi:RES domain-containing protein
MGKLGHYRTEAEPSVPAFLVPSVIVPQELNVVMYPQAAGFEARIRMIESFRIDPRLLGRRWLATATNGV